MGKLILCAGSLAKEPLHFVLTDTCVYSLEELGYYLYHNIYTITMDTFDETFFRWVELELKRPDLSEKWFNILQENQDLKELIISILGATDYFTKLEIENLIKVIDQINGLLPVQRRKMEGDNCLRYGDFDKALQVYKDILVSDDASVLSAKEYGNILHNIGVIHAQMRSFERAQREFVRAYSLNQEEESLKEYLLLLRLQNKEKEFMQAVLEYDISEEKVQEYNGAFEQMLADAEKTREYRKIKGLPALKESGKVGDYYYTIDTMIFNWKQQYKHGMEQG